MQWFFPFMWTAILSNIYMRMDPNSYSNRVYKITVAISHNVKYGTAIL